MTPDQELTQQLRDLNDRLGSLDVELMKIKSHMESLESAIERLTEEIRKKHL